MIRTGTYARWQGVDHPVSAHLDHQGRAQVTMADGERRPVPYEELSDPRFFTTHAIYQGHKIQVIDENPDGGLVLYLAAYPGNPILDELGFTMQGDRDWFTVVRRNQLDDVVEESREFRFARPDQ